MHSRYFISSLFDRLLVTMACAIPLSSCVKLNQAPPAGVQLQTVTVFSNDANAEAAGAGLFTEMMTHPRWLFNGSLALYPGLSGDELHINGQPADARELGFARDTLSGGNALSSFLYGAAFTYINDANAILQGLMSSTGVSTPVKKKLQGEAKFSRALSYFYLVNLFGDVPYITGINYAINEAMPRMPSSGV
jgi:starch-binding outer membrane protein, SusD/RagB family